MIQEILNQIKEKERELEELNSRLESEGLERYKFLIGKFYRLAATCYINVTGINYLNERSVNIECLKIQGGKYDGGHIEVTYSDDYNLKFSDIEEESLSEITRSQFLLFAEEALGEAKKRIIEIS